MSADPKPPRLAVRFLHWFLRRELSEEVVGDLEEKYQLTLERGSARQANWQYWRQVLNYLRPFAIRPDLITDLNPLFMFRSHLKIAWRSLLKNKRYAALNLTGMTVGLTCFLLITMYIQYESSYDQQHTKADRIYRVVQRQQGNMFQGTDEFALAPCVMVPTLLEDFPEVETGTTISFGNTLVWDEQEAQYETGLFADSNFFSVFDHQLRYGSLDGALRDPEEVILTQRMAEKYFGHENPVGQTLLMDDEQLVTVRAVVANPPKNQHFDFDYVTTLENYGPYPGDSERWKWVSNNYRAYVVLPAGYDHQVFTEKLGYLSDVAKPFYKDFSFSPEYFLQPLTDIHLRSRMNMETSVNSSMSYMYLAGAIAIVILLLALINYINLTTARATQRVREVGVRKTLGAGRLQLVGQFFTESLIIVGLSLLLAVSLTVFLIPGFNQFMDLEIGLQWLGSSQLLLGAIGLLALLVLGAGLYPALLSSIAEPIQAIRGTTFQPQGKRSWLGRAMVVGQFVAAIVLASGSIIIYQQLQFIQQKNLGYNREQIVFIPFRDQEVLTKDNTFKMELLAHPGIEKVSFSSQVPLQTENQGIAKSWEGNQDKREVPIYRNWVDYNFLELYEMELVAGRSFSLDQPTDKTEAYLLNEAAVKALGWEEAVGKQFEEGHVIGVVRDFHFQPFDLAIEPMFIRIRNEYTSRYGAISVKIRNDQQAAALAHLQEVMQEVLPTIPYDLRYLDEAYNQLYQTETRFGEAFVLFTGLAIFIACLGLLGLVTHQVQQRTKEIGIRKVLGASVTQILQLISASFLWQVVLATLIAAPLAWYGMHLWLQGFAYRINLGPWVFLIVGAATLLIALVTISAQSLRAALASPVEAIKIE